MKDYIDIVVHCINNDFVRKQTRFNNKVGILMMLNLGWSVFLSYEFKKMRSEMAEIREDHIRNEHAQTKEEEM